MQVQLNSTQRSVRNVSIVKRTISETIESLYENCNVECEKRIEDGKVIIQLIGNNTITRIEVEEILQEDAV